MSKWFAAVLCAGLLFVLGIATAAASPPANDAFAGALPLEAGQETSGVNLDATVESEEPEPSYGYTTSNDCSGYADGPDCGSSVWYAFEAPADGEYTIETCDGGTDVDTVLGIYTGATLGTLMEIASNDDACTGGWGGNGSRVHFAATAGTVYHVQVNGYADDEGAFYLRAYAGAPVDRPAPETTISREFSYAAFFSNRGALSGPRFSPSFALGSDTPGTSYECSLDGGAYAPCTSPVDYQDLAPGSSHTFKARAVASGVADPTPAGEVFTLDQSPSETNLVSGPVGSTSSTSPTWVVSASGERPLSNGYRCALDREPMHTCGAKMSYISLCPGPHTFRSAAWDRAGNLDPTPVTAQIEVEGALCLVPTLSEPTTGSVGATSADIEYDISNSGYGANLMVEYGTTTAYGMSSRGIPFAPGDHKIDSIELQYLQPETRYHYRLKLELPEGSLLSEDHTFMTEPSATVPTGTAGTPVLTEHTAAIPVTVEPAGDESKAFLLISKNGPVTEESTYFANWQEPVLGPGAQTVNVQVIDLEPSTTYHYRVGAYHDNDSNSSLGPEESFTTPPLPVTPTEPTGGGGGGGGGAGAISNPLPTKTHFRLTKKAVSVGNLTRHSKRLPVRVKSLPGGTVVKLTLTAGRAKLKAKQRAGSDGLAKFNLKLSKKVQKALQAKTLKLVKLLLVTSPPGDSPSSVALSQKPKQP